MTTTSQGVKKPYDQVLYADQDDKELVREFLSEQGFTGFGGFIRSLIERELTDYAQSHENDLSRRIREKIVENNQRFVLKPLQRGGDRKSGL
jgi:hypothetical protein